MTKLLIGMVIVTYFARFNESGKTTLFPIEQIIWTKENNLEPNIGNNQRIANDYLSPAHTNIRNNYR